MAATATSLNISKVSGVLFVTYGLGLPKSYFGAIGNYVPYDNRLGFEITIVRDVYSVLLTDLQVNGQVPSSFSTASILLNSIFGT